MSDVSLQFLGEEYLVPKELCEFVGYINEFENVYNRLLKILTQDMVSDEFFSIPLDTYENAMKEEREKIVVRLSEYDIYDCTTKQLVEENNGFIRLSSVFKETLEGWKQIILDAISDFERGYNSAHASAYSQITGSGVFIWTRSLSSALLYTVMEASTIKQQTRKANKEYTAAMESLNKKNTDDQKYRENQLLATVYYPGVLEALNLFTSELMEKFIERLHKNGIFNYDKVKHYNLQCSSELLKNISMINNKHGVLKQVFLMCPYNPDVYQKVLQYGLCDVDTFKTAQYFYQDKLLLSYLEDYCVKNSEDMDRIAAPITVLAMYKKIDEIDIIKSLYNDDLMRIQAEYNSLIGAIDNPYMLDEWVRNNIDKNIYNIIDKTELFIEDLISKKINNTISQQMFDKLVNLKLISVESIRLKSSSATELSVINNELKEKLLSLVQSHIKEAKERKIKYEVELLKYNEQVRQRIAEIENMKTQLKV